MTRLVNLSAVAAINPPRAQNLMPEDEVAFVAMANVSEEGELLGSEIRKYTEVATGYTAFQRGDVLLAKITPCFENGKTCITTNLPREIAFGSTEFHVLRASAELSPNYLHHLIRSQRFRIQGEKRMTGSAGQRRVPADFLRDFEFLLPSFDHQCRIAATLEKADRLRKMRREAVKLANELLRSVFLDMFGDPTTNPKGLAKENLGNLIKLRSGNFLPSHEMAGGGDVPVYGGNGINGYHNQHMFEERKVVIGRVGAYCGVVHVTAEKNWITDNALYVAEQSNAIQIDYLAFALRFANLNQYASQSGQPLVSGSRIYPVEILLPDEHEQLKFESILRKTEQMAIRQQLSAAGADQLFYSMQQQAFS